MSQVVRVEFPGPARAQYCSSRGATFARGDTVVVETEWGVGIGTVGAILPPETIELLKAPPPPVLRRATPTDLTRRTALSQREREARTFCRDRILARGLPMKLTEVRIGLDSSKAMFYFTAEGRVDFRELVKDLVQHLRTRVELRQIGVRDEAKVLGSSGACGRPVCCHAFLQGFAPVSIRMAKDQNLALNPGKLSGICGRLKCCLAYEHCQYAELRQGLPKVGGHVLSSRGPGVIRAQNILEQTVVVELETGRQVTPATTEITPRPRPETSGRAPESNRPGGAKGGKGSGGDRGRRAPRSSDASPRPAAAEGESRELSRLEDA